MGGLQPIYYLLFYHFVAGFHLFMIIARTKFTIVQTVQKKLVILMLNVFVANNSGIAPIEIYIILLSIIRYKIK